MKYITVLADGMADEPLEALGGMTCMEAAKTPVMDALAPLSEVGLVKTVPDGMKPGSDVANLAVLGYDPARFYSGRSPLEALSIGVPMKDTDVAMRCNFVTLTEENCKYEHRTIIDHSASEISTEDCAVLVDAVKKELIRDPFSLYVGTSYRHCLIWDRGRVVELAQPHDIPGRVIGEYLPAEPILRQMMERSFDILNNHPINVERAAKGLHKANSMWFWGAGVRPALADFKEKTGMKGAMISAVDLLKGIATGAGMEVIIVDGANGMLETNYEGKADAAVDALKRGNDFVYIHVEAPDEMGHQGSIERKVKAIENIDGRVLGRVKEKMDAWGEPYRILLMPDHPTPICVRTHTGTPVPYLIYDSRKSVAGPAAYNEKTAAASGILHPVGYKMIETLFEK